MQAGIEAVQDAADAQDFEDLTGAEATKETIDDAFDDPGEDAVGESDDSEREAPIEAAPSGNKLKLHGLPLELHGFLGRPGWHRMSTGEAVRSRNQSWAKVVPTPRYEPQNFPLRST